MATAIEVAVIAGVLLLAIFKFRLIGVTAAALAAVCGRICAVAYLHLAGRETRQLPVFAPGA
jgi:hypothetical protein